MVGDRDNDSDAIQQADIGIAVEIAKTAQMQMRQAQLTFSTAAV